MVVVIGDGSKALFILDGPAKPGCTYVHVMREGICADCVVCGVKADVIC